MVSSVIAMVWVGLAGLAIMMLVTEGLELFVVREAPEEGLF